ncbi:MAG: methyl-accepting chemotaxis protein, partial [Comamonas sp.]|nr:methyl-accepting chemotaxis protein [Candidatus Comamonas equi]
QAFVEMQESSDVMGRNVRALTQGDAELGVQSIDAVFQEDLGSISVLAQRAEKNAKAVQDQKTVLTKAGDALRSINRQSATLLELAENVAANKLQQGATAPEIMAANQLVMLTQRIGKSANEFQTVDGVSPEAVFLLGRDLNTFKELTDGMMQGNAELRLPGVRDAQTRQHLTSLQEQYEQTRIQATSILSNLQGLVAAREAQNSIIADSEPLRSQLEVLQSKLSEQAGISAGQLMLLLLLSLFVLSCGVGISRVQLLDSRVRQELAEQQQRDARRQEQEAKRVNDANQAAILRLMNELQNVAEGDLTQEATVTEDITGAIADSVNYTVEELRQLVGNVQNTATRVAHTTAQVDTTSSELLATSSEQLREIRETGQSILNMASRINNVSGQA